MWAGLDIIPNPPTFDDAEKFHAEAIARLRELGKLYDEIGGVVVISPNYFSPDAFPINNGDPLPEDRRWHGTSPFLSLQHRVWDGLPFLADSLQKTAKQYGVPVIVRPGSIDHSIWAPMRWMFAPEVPMPMLPVGLSDQSPGAHFRFGQAIREAVVQAPKPIAVLVSSNLTHRSDWLSAKKKALPREGQLFDAALLKGLQAGDWTKYDKLGQKIKAAASPEMPQTLWALMRGLSAGLHGELRHYSTAMGAYGMAVVHYETKEAA